MELQINIKERTPPFTYHQDSQRACNQSKRQIYTSASDLGPRCDKKTGNITIHMTILIIALQTFAGFRSRHKTKFVIAKYKVLRRVLDKWYHFLSHQPARVHQHYTHIAELTQFRENLKPEKQSKVL